MSRASLVRAVVSAGAVMSLGIGLLVPSSERWVVRAAAESSSAGDLPYLQVDGRFLTAGGEPFFWLADTAWAMLGKLSTDEITEYLGVRADQGFNVVQTVAMFPQAGADSPGDTVEAAAQNDEYWDNVEFAIDAAAERGLYLAIHPVWGDKQTGSVIDEASARGYGEFLGERFGAYDNVTWTLGGDHPADGEEQLWTELAEGLDETGGTQLKTYHPRGDQSSATWFADADWLDFNMIQGGHCLRYDVRADLVDSTYAATPAKPFLDGEPIYEEHPYCWEPDQGFSTAQDVRRDAYWSVLGGAAGHTYGHHAVWQFNDGGEGELGARGSWTEALEFPAGEQMRHLRELMESLPFTRGEPDQSVLTSEAGSGAERIVANVASNGSYLLVYSPAGQGFSVDTSVVTGSPKAYWFNPRTGEFDEVEVAEKYSPPTGDEDWLLLVEDTA
ncbi:MAG: glycoside hydrolase family 140 protein [Microlunatus sp.]|nr:glycoside hydrolase family 140 protein [Microlunatus sp.]